MDKEEIKLYYKAYLQSKLDSKTISKGSFRLLLLSESAFDDYHYQFTESSEFKDRQLEVYKSWNRDRRINDLLK